MEKMWEVWYNPSMRDGMEVWVCLGGDLSSSYKVLRKENARKINNSMENKDSNKAGLGWGTPYLIPIPII